MLTYALCLSVLNAIFSRGAVIEAITESPTEPPPLFALDGFWTDGFILSEVKYMLIKPLDKHLQFSVHVWMTNLMTLTMDCEAGEDAYACETTPMTTTHAMGTPHQMRDERVLDYFFNQEPRDIVIIPHYGGSSLKILKGDMTHTFVRRSSSPEIAYPFKGSWGIPKSSEGEFDGVAVQINDRRETRDFHISMNMTIANSMAVNSMAVNAECRKPVPLDYGVAYTCNKFSFRSIGVMGSPEDMENERRFETLFGKMQGKDITLSSDPHNIDMIRLTGDDASLTLNRDPLRPGEALLGDWVLYHGKRLNGVVGVIIEPLDKRPLDKHLHFSVHMKVVNDMTLTMDCDPKDSDPQGNVVYACKTTPMTTTRAVGSPDQIRDEALLASFFNEEPKEVLISPKYYSSGFLYRIYKGDSYFELIPAKEYWRD